MNRDGTTDAVARILGDPVAALGSAGIGFVGPDVPLEVLLATGRGFGHLPWRTSGDTPWADRWLESSFPYWARSILEQWQAGTFDALATVIFSRADDATQRLYYYVTELQRRGRLSGPTPVLFDIALVRRQSSLAHTAAAIVKLCRALDVEPDLLSETLERANLLRRTLQRIEAARISDGPLYERINRAALWSDPTQWIEEIAFSERSACHSRVLLAGSMPPDDRIHEAAEAAAASVVAEAHMHAPQRPGPQVRDGQQNPELTLAKHLQMSSVSPRAMMDRSRWIVDKARAARADAVVLWLSREDEALAWHVPSQVAALRDAGIRTLVLSAADWRFDDRQRDHLSRFLMEHTDAAT